jgi:hypothetical protein
MKPKLKPPATKRLKQEYDGLLSNFGFKFNLRRCNQVAIPDAAFLDVILVGRCRLTL